MLFKPANRSIEFNLVGLDSKENAEISQLIIENGGIINNQSIFKFTSCQSYSQNEDVFHINYVRECVKRGRLLELMNFKYGNPGLIGCLMNLFITGKRICPIAVDFYPNYTSTQISESEEPVILGNGSMRMRYEHNYADEDIIERQSPNKSYIGKSCNHIEYATEIPPIDDTLPDSLFEPSQSCSSKNSEQSKNENESQENRNNNLVEAPEAVTYEQINSPKHSPKISPTRTKTICKWIDGMENIYQPTDPLTSGVYMSVTYPMDAPEVIAKNGSDGSSIVSESSFEDVENISIYERLRRLQTSSSINSDASKSSKPRLKKPKRTVKKLKIVDEATASGDDRSGIKVSCGRVKNFQSCSSDSEDTIYNNSMSSGGNLDRTSKKDDNSKKQNLKVKSIQSLNENETCQNNDVPGPSSRVEVVPEKNNEIEIINHVGKHSVEKIDETNCSSVISKKTSKLSNEEKKTTVSSTKLGDDVSSVSDTNSDIEESSQRVIPTKTRWLRNREIPISNLTENNKDVPQPVKPKRRQVLTRNFLPWEQREMVKYLIDNNLISEAKGNRVWQQMIADGFLTHRTYFSLNNHFRRAILPVIHRFPMNTTTLEKFQKLRR